MIPLHYKEPDTNHTFCGLLLIDVIHTLEGDKVTCKNCIRVSTQRLRKRVREKIAQNKKQYSQ
jgi:hypothetical protein